MLFHVIHIQQPKAKNEKKGDTNDVQKNRFSQIWPRQTEAHIQLWND